MGRRPKSLIEQYGPPDGTVAHRIALAIDEDGRAASEISEEALGLKDAIRNRFNGESDSAWPSHVVEALAKVLNIRASWLLTGQGTKSRREYIITRSRPLPLWIEGNVVEVSDAVPKNQFATVLQKTQDGPDTANPFFVVGISVRPQPDGDPFDEAFLEIQIAPYVQPPGEGWHADRKYRQGEYVTVVAIKINQEEYDRKIFL